MTIAELKLALEVNRVHCTGSINTVTPLLAALFQIPHDNAPPKGGATMSVRKEVAQFTRDCDVILNGIMNELTDTDLELIAAYTKRLQDKLNLKADEICWITRSLLAVTPAA